MARSFSLVDSKLTEADFFLEKIAECGFEWFSLRCYVSAFIASARSVTFALQAVLNDQEGFKDWYTRRQELLKKDATARFFHEFRTINQHVGDNLVSAGSGGPDSPMLYWFMPTPDVATVPDEDVLSACRKYMLTITSLIFDCYIAFGPHIDAHQYYTAEHFDRIGKTVEDAEEEIGFPRGWTDIGDPDSLPHRWSLLRRQVAGCEVNHIFEKYLGRVTPQPAEPPPYYPKRRDDGETP